MDWVEGIKQISILIGIWVAIYGIDSWRREHTGKRQIELAEDTLALFYESVDVIKRIRHPFSFAGEIEDVERIENESEKAWKARKNASVVFKRYNSHLELFNKLYAMRYRFMAQIGKDKAKPFDDLKNITNEIIISARILARLWARDHFRTDKQRQQHEQNMDKYEAVFWEGLEEDDPINPKLIKIIEEMEEICRKVISGKGTLYSFINRKIS